jgi:hypothetical protein
MHFASQTSTAGCSFMAHKRRPILVELRQAARPNSEATRLDDRDELSAARGVVNGVVLGAGICLIGLLVWFLI